MPTKRLPHSANLDHLKHQAKDLLRDVRQCKPSALQRIREFHPKHATLSEEDLAEISFSLSDAQLSIAREYGYASWPRLKTVLAEKQHVELVLSHNDRLPDGPFKQALDIIDEGDAARLRAHLGRHPGLVHETASFEGGNYFTNPTLLEFIPENPTRQEKLPPNAVEIAEILLEAGAKSNQTALNETVMLAASGRVCREFGVQDPLIRLLCHYGADPAAGMHSALAHEEFAAARVLIECGAVLDLSTAAALNELEALKGFLKDPDQDQLQLGLALAATCGWDEAVTLLLQAGADPDRYNPPGGHSHCTPLHSAVAGNRLLVVETLMAHGARLDIRDIHHNMTPLDWALYMKHDAVAAILKR